MYALAAMVDVALTRFHAPPLEAGTWTSPWVEPGFAIADAIPSWCASAPPGSGLRVRLQGRVGERETGWYDLGRWTEGPERSSVPGQDDADGRVEVDVLVAREAFAAVRTIVVLEGPGEIRSLTLAVAGPRTPANGASKPVAAPGTELDVPPLSQQSYAGVLPELDGGGEAWCSPTSLAMVAAFWGASPPGDAVVAAARGTYDTAYRGCGNWAFNAAYAATLGLDAFVTRLRSLAEAEQYLHAAIPLVLSIRCAPGELTGFPLRGGTRGHLIVLRGIDARGSAIVNDPAAATPEEVRRIYDRAELERAWLDGSGGATYVVRRSGVALPSL